MTLIASGWILEALQALGGSGTTLDVSKQVWARHRDDIEASGELIYTWQLDLRDTATELAAHGQISGDGERWNLAADAPPPARPGAWTAEDILIAVDAYITMLQADHDGRPVNRREAMTLVTQQTGRTSAAVEAIFANVSAVVQENGYEYLSAYPPKSNVPAGVRPAVAVALNL